MKTAALVFSSSLLMVPSAFAADNQLVGTWKLQSFIREVIATGQRYKELGEKSDGYVSYLPDNRMFLIVVADNRVKPSTTVPTDDEKIKLFGTIVA